MRATAFLALALTGAVAPAAAPDVAPTPAAAPWGVTRDGQQVERFVLRNAHGLRVTLINWGATLTAIEVPDRHGRPANIVLNLPDIASYERSARRWAGVVGRYAGRIDGAQFTLDGEVHRLEPGRNGVTLHGGSDGYDHRVWRAEPFSDPLGVGVTFHLDSPDGDQGFPGRLGVSVTYRLARDRNQLSIGYRATTDRATVVNLTNHGFINLAGAGAGDIGAMVLQTPADRVAEVDGRKIPTGRLLPVAGTPLDFRAGATLAERLRLLPDGIDHSLVLPRGAGLRRAATVSDPVSGRRLEIVTTEPSLQLNSGGGFDGSEKGGEGVAYAKGAGLAIETQHLPDSPNRPSFPSTEVRPGRPYRSLTIYRFPSPRAAPAEARQG